MAIQKKEYTEEQRKEKMSSVNEVIDQLEQEMKDRYGLRCVGSGGSMPYDIISIKVMFNLRQTVTLEEARELEVKCIERFIEIINGHEGIRKYLSKYPCDYETADIMISFRKNNGQNVSEGISLVLVGRGNICYFEPEVDREVFDPIKREPYYEAKKIVDESPSCLKPVSINPEKSKKTKKWVFF